MKRKKDFQEKTENYYKDSFMKDPWNQTKKENVHKESSYFKESFLQDPWAGFKKIEPKEKIENKSI